MGYAKRRARNVAFFFFNIREAAAISAISAVPPWAGSKQAGSKLRA
jgi:hypothetical protein